MNDRAALILTSLGPIAFCLIPKCGQHTLESISVDIVGPRELKSLKRVAFIREPIDRLKSAYHFFLYKGYTLEGQAIGGWESFIDWALESNEEHIRPQATFTLAFDNFIKMDFMTEVLESITENRIDALNAAPRYNDVDDLYRIDDITKKYKDDFILYESALDGIPKRGF